MFTNLKNSFTGRVSDKCVGFVAAAVSMPMGGCRARRPVGVSSVAVDIPVAAAEPAVL